MIKKLLIIIIAFTLVLGLGLVWYSNKAEKVQAAWFDDLWTYRIAVPVTAHTSNENHVYWTPPNINTSDTTRFTSNCGNVRWTDANGKILKYYVSSGCGGASTVFNVYLESFPAGAQTFYYYYGNLNASDGRTLTAFTTAASGVTNGSAQSEEFSAGPIAYWKLDDGSIGTARDSTNNGLNGIHNNTPTLQISDFCVSDRCLWFDGTNNENISLADNANLDFAATENFTVSAWAKRNGTSSAINYIISKADTTTGGYKLWMDADGDFCFGIDDDTAWGPDISTCSTSQNFDNDQWHHIVGVRDVSADIVAIYIDGVRYESQTDPTTATLANSNIFYIGVDRDGTSNEWLGFIDEVKIYRFAKTASQVKADYNSGKNNQSFNKGASVSLGAKPNDVLSNGLVGYWRMDDASGSPADSSGNASTLTNVNTVADGTGKFGIGADLESGNSEYYFVADNAFHSVTGSLTLSAWIRPESVGAGTYHIHAKWDGSNESYRFYQSADELVLEIESGNYVTTNTTNLVALNWYHVAGVYNNLTQTAKIYVNGIEQSTTATGTIPSSIGDDTSPFQIGAEDRNNTPKNFYDGIIDEARIYNRALFSSEVQQLYNFAPGPSLHWQFDEGTGSSAFDKSGNGYTGTLLPTNYKWVTGKVGGAIDLTRSNTDEAGVSASDVLDMGTATDFTLSVWTKQTTALPSTSASDNYTFIGKIGASGGVNGYDLRMYGTGEISMVVTDGTNSFECYTATNPLTIGQWYHITATFSQTFATTCNIYFNGVVQSVTRGTQTALNNVGTLNNADDFVVGENNIFGVTMPFAFDDAKVYTYIRTPGQIVEDMNSGHPLSGSPIASQQDYWKLDEGQGNYASSSGIQKTTANLSTLMANPASIGISGWLPAGKFGKGLAFDGTNDNLNLGDLSYTESTGTMSATFWVNPNNLTTTDCLICKYNGSAATQRSWAIETGTSNSSAIRVTIPRSATEADGTTFVETPTGKLANGNWSHVAVVYDTSQTPPNPNAVKIYIDGVISTNNTVTGTFPSATQATTSNARVGSSSDGARFFSGQIDEIKLYSGALTREQVLIDMTRGQSILLGAVSTSQGDGKTASQSASATYCIPEDTTSCNPPRGEWQFEEKQGVTTADSSGNGYTGTLTNGPAWVSGKYGSGIRFDGANDGITSSIPINETGAYSVSYWIYPYTLSTDDTFISTSIDGDLLFSTYYSSNIIRWCNDTLCGNEATSRANILTTRTWNHISTVYNGSGTATIYVNGINVTEDNNIAESNGGAGIIIGNTVVSSSPGSNATDGIIDNIRVYDYARTPAQIAWDYNQGKPIDWFKFNECQGSVINDSIGTASATLTIGASGTQTALGDCIVTTGAWLNGATGKFNSSINFDGTDDYISTTNFPIPWVMDTQSYSAWIKTSTSGQQGILTVGNDSPANSTSDRALRLTTSNYAQFQICNAAGSTCTFTATGNQALNDGNWHHLVGVYDGTNVYIYVDGKEQGRDTGAVGRRDYTTPRLNIGHSRNAADSANIYFTGQIDEVKAWNYNLTAEQVKIDYNQGSAVRFGPTTGSP